MLRFLALFRSLLDRRTLKRAIWAVAGAVVAAILEAIGLLLIVPLVQLVTMSSGSTLPTATRRLADLLGGPPPLHLAAYLAGIAFAAFLLKGALSLALLQWNLGFVLQTESELSRRLLDAYLHAPYVFHLRRNSAELQRTIHDDIRRVFEDAAVALVGAAADVIVLAAIVTVLVAVKPLVAIAAFAYFAAVGFGYQRLIHGRARGAGEIIHHELAAAYRTVQQGVSSIKVVKLRHKEEYFTTGLYEAKRRSAARLRTILLLYQAPRYYLETAMVFGVGIMSVLSYRLLPTGDATAVVGLFLAAGFRLLPSLNRILVSNAAVRAALPSLEAIRADLDLLEHMNNDSTKEDVDIPMAPGPIEMHQVSFHYGDSQQMVLRDISMRIDPGESVAIVGGSGAGKSTLLDLLLGLLEPTRGSITVGGRPLASIRTSWQRSIGYVPQDVVLLDETIRSNIAFGDVEATIDDLRVASAIYQAQLSEFVGALPQGASTEVDEGGVRLSGGQRQRVGIARALYHTPSTLVFDEATSALDADTEHRLAQTIDSLQGTRTIIVVTHRLTTVKNCDRIYFLENGEIVGSGSFNELMVANGRFRALVELSTARQPDSREAGTGFDSLDAPPSRSV